MCGRYTLQSPSDVLAELYEVEGDFLVQPRFNIAPTQNALVLREAEDGDGRELVNLKWGLIPFFSKDMKMAARMINARAETLAEKPSFRAAFKKRRCIIPASGFFEWRAEDGQKQPYYLEPNAQPIFHMAGLHERWRSSEFGIVDSFTIITTEANKDMQPYHHRMPVMLDHDDFDIWLDSKIADRSLIQSFLSPWADGQIKANAVSTRVNSPKNDDPQCIEYL